MFKVFKAFVQKELYHILRDKRTLLILFGMPVAQVLIFGYAVTNEFRDAYLDIYDQAGDHMSQELVQHLQSSGHFQVNNMIRSDKQLEDGFKAGTTKLAVVIPVDFASDLSNGKSVSVQLLADGSDPNNANTLVQYASTMITSFQKERLDQSENPYQIGVQTRMLYNPQLASAHNFVPGTIALILLIISAMMTSLTIAREKELGTMEILLVSPLPPLLIILGKVAPYAALSFIDALLVLILGYFVFDVPIVGNLLLLLAVCFLYVVAALALGTLISTVSKTQQDAMLRSLMGLMMPSMLLSGFIFPLASMPKVLQVLGSIIPATYFIEILKGVMLRGVGFDLVVWEVMILVGMTVFLLFMSYRNFKIRLE
ncbi:ABC transporter permease [Flavobacteriaceae bacterium TP-CH-4]|uniref:Transport permease protein n=1 Tax=Pelagihabitans pacificus TaxID=2696054 RepID=A0A967AUU1_9FLAO|nr:ABC transporter permease [Pelagihabitans pacificus]NHF59575.1 ABC transporter permease [Pelagihabitans pacificus]